MGRLAASWAGREITDRSPYEMAGELALTTGQGTTLMPEGLLQVGVDKPFEVHRLIPRIYARDSSNILINPQPDQELLQGLVKLDLENTGLQLKMTKVPTVIGAIVKGSSERTWEFAEPMTISRSNGFQASLQAATFPANTAIASLNNLLVTLVFEGFLLIVAPPMGNR